MRRESHAKSAFDRATGIEGDEEALVALQAAALTADRDGDDVVARKARDVLMYRSHATDRVREQFAAFAWLLHADVPRSDDYWGHSLMWTYKWVASNLSESVLLSRAQIEAILESMAQRYAREGLGTAPIQAVRLELAITMGDAPSCSELFAQWKSNQDQAGADCAACVLETEVSYLLARGELDEALKTSEPLLERRMGCAVVPHVTYAKFLLPLVERGDLARAGQFYARGKRLLKDLDGCGDTFARHACYLACGGFWKEAFSLLVPRLGTLLRARAATGELLALLAIELACRGAIRGGIGAADLSLPSAVPDRPVDGVWDLGELLAWASSRANAMAAAMDERNGNAHFTGYAARWRAVAEAGLALPRG